jgi:hypothetical protein
VTEHRYFALARFSAATPEVVHNPSFERVLLPAISYPAAITAIVFLFLATPLHIYSAYNRVNFSGHGGGPAYLLVRLRLQLFLIAWIWCFGCVSLDLISVVHVKYRK